MSSRNADAAIQALMSERRGTVAALAATTTVGYGALFYAYGVLLVPMQDDLGWSRSFLTGAFSAALLTAALLTLVVGRWLDRHDPRPLFVLGGVAAALLVVAWGASDDKAVFAGVWILLGACQAVLFYEPAFTVLTKWLHGAPRHRAVTSVTLLAGLASTIFGPLTAGLEHWFGWRGAVFVLAGLLAAVTVPCFTLGLRSPPPIDDVVTHEHTLPSAAFASPQFWYLTVAYLLNAMTTFGIAVLLVPYLRDRGMHSGVAASALGGVGLVQVLGRSTFTRLSARVRAVELGTWILAMKAVGLSLLLVVPGLPGVVSFVVVYGAANGIATLTRAMAVAELYGPTYYGSISSVLASVGAVAGALAPFVAAAAIEIAGDDDPILWGFVAISVLAAFTSARVSRFSTPTGDVENPKRRAG
jgi:MFS family permease